jgi:hypothetical protein
MPTFLIRDDNVGAGSKVHHGALSRTRELSYVPWALTADGRTVVYAPTGQHRNRPNKGGLRPYDTLVSQERRKLCQSALGSIALTQSVFSNAAIAVVSRGVKRYLIEELFKDADGMRKRYAETVGKYMYGMKYRSLGRFSDVEITGPDAYRKIWEQAIDTLDAGTPHSSVLSIHDGVGKILDKFGDGARKSTYNRILTRLRPARPGEILDPTARGRTNVSGAQPTTQAGIAGPEHAGSFPVIQSHNRGMDLYRRAEPHHTAQVPIPATARREISGVSYYRDLDARNELFGAGPSGTTGTLLAAGFAFGDLNGEMLKQYYFGIIGYLIGGGMHSLHESLTVAKLLGPEMGMQYNSGSMLAYERVNDISSAARSDDMPALPNSFTSSPSFTTWRDSYYDIAVLGGIHWMFNGR